MSKRILAVAYYRTSSSANVEGDSYERQRRSVLAFAKSAGYQIVNEFYDAAVSGADPVDEREGFMSMLSYIASNGARTVLVESPDRFARDLMVQLAGHDFLRRAGIDLVPASAPDFFIDDTPTARLIRQVLGAVAEFEKATLVAKLSGARRRKRSVTGQKVEGRKNLAELHPLAADRAHQLRLKPKGGKRLSLRAVSAALAAEGHVDAAGKPFRANAVASLLRHRQSKG